MKNVLGNDVQLDDAFLDRMRQTVDPPADAVAATVVARNLHRTVGDLIKKRQMWDADGEPSRQLPEDIRAYMKEASALPGWRDEAQVHEAEQFFLLYGLASSTLLACASLPQCYVMKYGTEVLAYTKFLQVNPTRRIRETAQMVMDVMVPGGLKPMGRGVRATMKVRVMHAIVRHMIMNDPGAAANPSDAALKATFGLPINQEDMVYTLMTFSYVVIEGFGTMGYQMTDRQREGYIHCWNVVGYLMGIREELLPASFADAKELFEAIQQRQHGQSDAGQKLTAALLEAVQDAVPGDHHDPLVAALARKLVGDATADTLGIQRPTPIQQIRLDAVLDAWALSARLATELHADRPIRIASEELHHAIMVKMGGMAGAPFEVPEEFVKQWFPDDPPGSPGSTA
jgi:ER-bound oxygenase mpaB/B'/Rubber oxygenase, catalytic domain